VSNVGRWCRTQDAQQLSKISIAPAVNSNSISLTTQQNHDIRKRLEIALYHILFANDKKRGQVVEGEGGSMGEWEKAEAAVM